jgi:hypothetical protein
MSAHDIAEPEHAPPVVAPRALTASTVAVAARSAARGRLDPAGALALQRTAGNAAVGRLLARQPAPTADPFDLTDEDWAEIEAAAEKMRTELREGALAPLEGKESLQFLSKLRALQVGQRAVLQRDVEFWRRVRARLSGMAVWAVQLALEYGGKAPHEVNALSAAIHAGDRLRVRHLVMAYPNLKAVPGLREAVAYKFAGKERDDLFAVIAEPRGTRAESGRSRYREAHYEDGKIKRFTGTTNYELVRLPGQVRVIVRIRLTSDPASKKSPITDKAVSRWEQGISRRWNGKFRLRHKAETLDVWFIPMFVYHDPSAHHDVTVHPGDERSDENDWHEEDSGDTAAHEFGHMIGNPDEYNLPGAMAEIPAGLGLSDAEKRRSSYEGITGEKKKKDTDGYDMENLMGAHHESASVRERHAWDVLTTFNAKLRRPGEGPWVVELKK